MMHILEKAFCFATGFAMNFKVTAAFDFANRRSFKWDTLRFGISPACIDIDPRKGGTPVLLATEVLLSSLLHHSPLLVLLNLRLFAPCWCSWDKSCECALHSWPQCHMQSSKQRLHSISATEPELAHTICKNQNQHAKILEGFLKVSVSGITCQQHVVNMQNQHHIGLTCLAVCPHETALIKWMLRTLSLEQSWGCLFKPKQWSIIKAICRLLHFHVNMLVVNMLLCSNDQWQTIHWQSHNQQTIESFAREKSRLYIIYIRAKLFCPVKFKPSCHCQQKRFEPSFQLVGDAAFMLKMSGSWKPRRTSLAWAFQRRVTPSSESMRFQVNTQRAVMTRLPLIASSICSGIANCHTLFWKYWFSIRLQLSLSSSFTSPFLIAAM